MKLTIWRTCVLFGLLPFAFVCTAAPVAPANPSAVVPVLQYESAFTTYQPAARSSGTSSPDKVWRAANDAVAAPAKDDHAMHKGHQMPGVDKKPATTPPLHQEAPRAAQKMSHEHHGKGH